MGARLQARRGLVEADVPVDADPEDHQIDTAGRRNRALVAIAFLLEIRRRAVEKPHVARLDANLSEELSVHVLPVALGIATAEADELVEVERAHR